MDDDKLDLRALLKAEVKARRVKLDRHPSPEELEAFQAKALSPSEDERLRQHLSLCPDCIEFVLALAEFRGLDAPATEETPPEELNGAWKKLRAEIHEETPAREKKPRPFPARAPWLHLLAAVLALAVAGLSLWSFSLYRTNQRLDEQTRSSRETASSLSTRFEQERRRSAGLAARTAEQNRQIAELRRDLDEMLRPRINTPVLDLASRRPRGTGPAEPIPKVPKDADLFTLVLEPEDHRAFPGYAAEVLDAGGRVLWDLKGLHKTEFGSFTLTLARRSLPAGEVRIRLYGVQGQQRKEIGTYGLQIPVH